MKLHNPMKNPLTREKMRKSLRGRTFLARGGNGKLTPEQTVLAQALHWPTEVVIGTASVNHRFKSLPHHYKVDIGNKGLKLAIEVDGKTHLQKKWRFLDRRKTEVLNSLGWSVLRFWNQEITKDLPGVMAKIRAFIASK